MRVDHDYVIQSAKLAHAQGCKQLHVMSSMGVDKNSAFLYNKVKVNTFMIEEIMVDSMVNTLKQS